MTKPSQFLTLLHDLAAVHHIGADELADKVDVPLSVAREWFLGWSVPNAAQLPDLARALGADPLDVALGWLIDQAPDLEAVVYSEILRPRGTKVLHSTDLALRGPVRKPADVAMDVEDPHDVAAPRSGRDVASTRAARRTSGAADFARETLKRYPVVMAHLAEGEGAGRDGADDGASLDGDGAGSSTGPGEQP